MPGQLLAELHDRYGERLLEQNVRTFLQFRGNVNKGIRNTIANETTNVTEWCKKERCWHIIRNIGIEVTVHGVDLVS